MFYSIWWPRLPGDTSDVPPRQVRDQVERQFLGTVWEDLNIWRYQEYIENPALSRVDCVTHVAPARLGTPAAAPAGADPVVLVAGMGNDHRFMDVWQRSLAADGYRAFSFRDPEHGLGDARVAAARLGDFVEQVRAQTGAPKVDLVAFSAGITTARTWLSLDGGAARTDAIIDLDGPWAGDDDAFRAVVRSSASRAAARRTPHRCHRGR